ncbi:MAG: protein-L-isoaspartate(D-aspartate) O-methyltransferase [Gammaproteobacteria bacterium]|jgi:protein-L-isoaspartate(D-aspartate) O-methyltransferase|nr:protein-L-isoaspartate(D-aspartate) O-methyltransferase [Gammaproteobacteria bacterium]
MDTLAARQQMVDQQIRTWEVLDPRVLDVLSAVPREAFVPPAYRELAFADTPIPIGFGQSMLAPVLQGRILQSLAVIGSDTVLEVGTGTGYLTAAFGLLAGSIHSIDIRPEFTAAAAANLRTVPQARVELETRDAFNGASLGEYDVIAVTGSLPVYDTRFEKALRVGGRLFAVVGVAPVMDAILVRRVDSTEWIRESLFETVIDPLINAIAPQGFVF